jgi:hypothetical protein
VLASRVLDGEQVRMHTSDSSAAPLRVDDIDHASCSQFYTITTHLENPHSSHGIRFPLKEKEKEEAAEVVKSSRIRRAIASLGRNRLPDAVPLSKRRNYCRVTDVVGPRLTSLPSMIRISRPQWRFARSEESRIPIYVCKLDNIDRRRH